MGGCLSTKLIITKSLSSSTNLSNSNSPCLPPPPPTSTHHLLALLQAVTTSTNDAVDIVISETLIPPTLVHSTSSHHLSTTFHTVDEYDALLHTIRFSQTHHQAHPHSDVVEEQEQEQEQAQEQGDEGLGGSGGSKRKRVARGLGLLQLPPTLHNHTLTLDQSQCQWGGTSNYVTPKFGSYNDSIVPPTITFTDDNKIEPDLVAAYHHSMLQLQLEQDKLIKQIEFEAETEAEAHPFSQTDTHQCQQGGGNV